MTVSRPSFERLMGGVGLLLAVFLLFPPPAASLQAPGVITGRVVAGSGAQAQTPLPSTQVFIPELDLGVLTQANGTFVLQNVPAGTHTVTAQRIGYESASREVTVVGGQTAQLDFGLSEQVLALDEVIVTGTPGGTQRRALGNAVADMEFDVETTLTAAGSIEEILGNRLPGVQLTATSGAVGGGTKFRVRGSSSLALSGDPLIYVNGVRMDRPEAFAGRSSSVSTLQDINPSDIERIEVIKGPAAATLYGTEAANGVIQIFTKQGVAGEPVFDASIEGGATFLQNPAGKMGPMWYRDPDTGQLESVNSYLADFAPDNPRYPGLSNPFGKAPFRYGPLQQYNLGVRGGTDLIRYSASANYTEEEGYTYLDDNRRANGRVSLTIVPSEDWSITLNGAQGRSRVSPGWFIQGYFHLIRPLVGRRDSMNAMINARDDYIDGDRSTWSATFEHNPLTQFRQRLVVGLDKADFQDTTLFPKSTDADFLAAYRSQVSRGQKSLNRDLRETLTLDYAGIVTLPVTESLSSTFSAGLQLYRLQRIQSSMSGRDFATGALTTLDAASTITGASETWLENKTLGTYAQLETNWQGRIFLTGALRFDKNSAFGENAKAALYPKLSASWVVGEEAFWQDSSLGDFIPQMRLRGAWGASGQQPDVFAARRLYEAVPGPGLVPTLTPLAFGNPDLEPERGEEIELGFDAELFGGRSQLEFTWFRRVTKDALVERPVYPSIGFPGARFENVGQISAGGTEAVLNVGVLERPSFEWNIATALSTTWTSVDDLGGAGQIMVGRNQFHVQGFPVAGFFDIRVVDAEFVPGSTTVMNAMCDGGRGVGGREMGGPLVPCSDAPQVYYGQAEPAWTVALTNLFRYGDWTFRAVFDAKGGHEFNPDYLSGHNQWSSEPLIRAENPIWFGLRQFGARGAQVFADGGFVMLRELGLRYNIPEAVANSFGTDRASFSVSAHNVSVLWSEQGPDVDLGGRLWGPEIQSPGNNYAGVNMGGQPPGSRVTARIDVSF